MNNTKSKAARAIATIFALSLASTYVVRSQLAQNRSVASTSKSLSPVIGSSAVQPRTGSDQTLVAKTNAVSLKATASPQTNSVGKASAVTNVPPHLFFPGSKSAPVFDLQPSKPAPGQSQKASLVSTNTKSARR